MTSRLRDRLPNDLAIRDALATIGVLVVLGVLVWALFLVNARLRAERLDSIQRDQRLEELAALVEQTGDVLEGADLEALARVADAEDVEALRRAIRAARLGVAPAQTPLTPAESAPTNSAPGSPGPTGASGPPGPTATAIPAPSSPSRTCLLRVPVLDRCLTN